MRATRAALALTIVLSAALSACAPSRLPTRDPARICPPGTTSTLTRYEDGGVRELVCWKRDAREGHVQHGPHLRWYESGRQSYEAEYVEGALDGAVTTWREDGSVASELVYRGGRLVSCRLYPAGPCPAPPPTDTASALTRSPARESPPSR